MYTASSAFLEALTEAGVSYIFANFGSDHPALVEAIAEARANGRKIPKVVTAPFEMVGLSAAQGFAQVSGKPQAVVVHVECGTQSLAGAVHNAAKGRSPVLIFAGLSPFTQDGELKGSRNEFIQWIQDVYDQRGIVREYMKYDNEFRTGTNVKQIVHRAMQFATSDPKGPVYLVGAREVMEEEVTPVAIDMAHWRPVQPGALTAEGVDAILSAIAGARRPIVVTSFAGRNPEALGELVRFCEALGVGLLESVPSALNFPHSNPLYQGSHWNHPFQNPVLAEADVVLVLDSDVPWIPTVSRPRADATIFHIDVDPLKASMPLWYIPAVQSFRADAATALRQLNRRAAALALDMDVVAERRAHYAGLHQRRGAWLAERAKPAEHLTTEYVMARLRTMLGKDSIVLNEGITNYPEILDHIAPDEPGTFFASGGGSLGWNGGAAIGAKLAAPDKTVVAVTGDGSYMFSIPSSVHWMARHYKAPFLHIVLNNRGWKAPRFSALAVHPAGYAANTADLDVNFDPPPDYAGIAAAAGGAYARAVKEVSDVDAALAEGLRVVREEGRCAVLDIWLPRG
ncbi:thiamine pyrophosphate-requiring protein [Sphingomonas sp. CL5.1]|uniref:thiamine pyrophosphate-requiring protein n=1 Tax=Sphingomonas sp. CL5.1 TaxID=2653203 RepID=UPI0015832E0C|nr:thiamine pyrophosphate-requiring protein [Sphingomonas sp. CL5.1]QKR99562.1 thiamine pyrophosphate-requiring protein [Sphingomonas sp. CL5.1]